MQQDVPDLKMEMKRVREHRMQARSSTKGGDDSFKSPQMADEEHIDNDSDDENEPMAPEEHFWRVLRRQGNAGLLGKRTP